MNVKYTKRKTLDPKVISELSRRAGVSNRLAGLLAAREIDDADEARRFLKPDRADFHDPYLMPDMRAAVARIESALKNDERIAVFGDYDCDGVSAAAILCLYLKSRGGEVYRYIPDRADGYGLSVNAIDKLAESVFPDLIITVDCGITSVGEVEYCRDDLGIDVIITDHHTPRDVLPSAPILNPKTCGYPSELCGAGVAFKLVEAMSGFDEAVKYIDLAAIATVGDVVPLRGENRAIAVFGLRALNQRNKRTGIKKLFDSLKLETATASDIAFLIVPRLNAAGRMGVADRAFELLVSEDAFESECLVNELNGDNSARQALLNDIVGDVFERLKEYDLKDNRCIVLYDERWNPGVIGIACSRLVSEFNRPVILFGGGGESLKGSARSIAGVNIYEAMLDSAPLFTTFGGHAQAAGASIKKQSFDQFAVRINAYLKKYDDSIFAPEVIYDADISQKPSISEMEDISRLEPFGEGNPRPVFIADAKKMRFVRIGETSHLKERDGDFETVAFNMIDHAEILNSDTPKRIIMSAESCVYKNTKYVKGCVSGYFAEPAPGGFDKTILAGLYAFSCALAADKVKKNALNDKKNVKISKSPAKRFEKNALTDIIKNTDNLYGTAFIAYDDDTAADFYRLFDKECGKLLLFSFGIPESRNPYNRLILSPKNIDLSYYARVVFLDSPLFGPDGLYFGGSAYAAKDNPLDCVIKKSRLTDAAMRGIYIALRALLKSGGRADGGTVGLYAAVVKDKAVGYGDFLLALAVFTELGLIDADGAVRLTETKTSLEQSKIYRMLTE
ncbi:MAG: single-stranded-DNA-specific exonuclease RecJ [Clostridiales bacterium]|jgi:single-stranded-DNA-specific exonuclease|nr:single-stranded-DNA-specific exonuclease RecJ [Clostridiales bacterium]